MVGLALVVVIMIVIHPSAITSGNLEKVEAYCLQDLEITQHTCRHTVQSRVEGQRVCRQGFCFLLGSRVGA